MVVLSTFIACCTRSIICYSTEMQFANEKKKKKKIAHCKNVASVVIKINIIMEHFESLIRVKYKP